MNTEARTSASSADQDTDGIAATFLPVGIGADLRAAGGAHMLEEQLRLRFRQETGPFEVIVVNGLQMPVFN